jgi:hypothetical protein
MPAATPKKKKLSNAEAWEQATEMVRRRRTSKIGPLDDTARFRDLPGDDAAFWDEVEKEAVALGGHPAGPVG